MTIDSFVLFLRSPSSPVPSSVSLEREVGEMAREHGDRVGKMPPGRAGSGSIRQTGWGDAIAAQSSWWRGAAGCAQPSRSHFLQGLLIFV